jgi:hypothetical protein
MGWYHGNTDPKDFKVLDWVGYSFVVLISVGTGFMFLSQHTVIGVLFLIMGVGAASSLVIGVYTRYLKKK